MTANKPINPLPMLLSDPLTPQPPLIYNKYAKVQKEKDL